MKRVACYASKIKIGIQEKMVTDNHVLESGKVHDTKRDSLEKLKGRILSLQNGAHWRTKARKIILLSKNARQEYCIISTKGRTVNEIAVK